MKEGGKLQRLQEIYLLERLNSIIYTDEGKTWANWKQYVGLQGGKILSKEELLLWEKIIGEHYDAVPKIGFQLYFKRCVTHCLNLDLSVLATEIPHHDYAQFYKDNIKAIEAIDLSDKRFKESIEEYVKRWGAKSYRGIDWQPPLEEIVTQLQGHPLLYDGITNVVDVIYSDETISQKYRENCIREFRIMTVETQVRKLLAKHARQKLYRWFDQLYGFKLSEILDVM